MDTSVKFDVTQNNSYAALWEVSNSVLEEHNLAYGCKNMSPHGVHPQQENIHKISPSKDHFTTSYVSVDSLEGDGDGGNTTDHLYAMPR